MEVSFDKYSLGRLQSQTILHASTCLRDFVVRWFFGFLSRASLKETNFLTNQKRYPDLSSDTSSVWNFCKNLALYLLVSVTQIQKIRETYRLRPHSKKKIKKLFCSLFDQACFDDAEAASPIKALTKRCNSSGTQGEKRIFQIVMW